MTSLSIFTKNDVKNDSKRLKFPVASFFIILGFLVFASSCCRKFDSISIGMKEDEVRHVLGDPDVQKMVDSKSPAVFLDKSLIAKFGNFKLLIYKCNLNRDLFVSISPHGTVVKLERATFID